MQQVVDSTEAMATAIQPVLDGGYCIGCAACTAVMGSPVQMRTNDRGQYEAAAPPGSEDLLLALPVAEVCPFAGDAQDEDTLGRELFGPAAPHDAHVGHYLDLYAGHVAEGAFRTHGSSGGMARWVLHELLRQGHVDAVIQVHVRTPTGADPSVYRFAVVTEPAEVLAGSRSVYYPVEMTEVLAHVRRHPGRYAITGVPCFIKAVRLLAAQEPVFRERIRFCVGIICGHLKSRRYADMIAWQLGVVPGDLAAIDFRAKLPGTTAKQKGVVVRSRDPQADVGGPEVVQNLFGTDYNHGFFQYRACDYCDDVVAETADIAIGDAWLPDYIPDGRGTSLVIVRHPVLRELVAQAHAAGRLVLDPLTVEQVVASQAGGFRQRREGLAYRLHQADQRGAWRPPKRVAPSDRHLSAQRKRIYEHRTAMAERSHEAFAEALQAGDFDVFRRAMQPLLDRNTELYRPTLWHRLRRGLERRFRRWFRS